MSESVPPSNQTKFEEPVTGFVHTGLGDINVLVSSLSDIITLIRKKVPSEGDALERWINALRQLSLYQKSISELKTIHNMLHNLENALAIIESPIRIAVLQGAILSFHSIDDSWRIAVLPRLRDMKYFASYEMKFSEGPRFEYSSDKISGPSWIVDLLVLQRDFEANLQEQNINAIDELARNILDACREHLYRVDRQLLDAINKLDQLSDQILRGIDNG